MLGGHLERTETQVICASARRSAVNLISRCLTQAHCSVADGALQFPFLSAKQRPTVRSCIFGKLTATATREAAAPFMAMWYRRTYGRGRRRLVAVCRVTLPVNCASVVVGLRHRLGLSQRQMAAKVGAASEVVVYQWETGKRKPSRVFSLRIERLQRLIETPRRYSDA